MINGKISLVLIIFLLAANSMFAQKKKKDDTTSFDRNVTIGQSMATSEQQALPAQFSITFPQHKAATYLVNAGAQVDVGSIFSSKNLVSFIGEYHRNTQTDSIQNTLQLGIKGTWEFARIKSSHYWFFLTYDPQYIHDWVKMTHSAGTDFLFTWKSILHKVNFGKINQKKGELFFYKPAIVAGAQVQQVFAGDTSQALGFKLRPLGMASFSFGWLKDSKDKNDPLLQFDLGYTQRIDVVNSTDDKEKFTHLVRAGINYFFLADPVKLSIGLSFQDGSDPFAGLKQQQYWLLSFNISKTPKKSE